MIFNMVGGGGSSDSKSSIIVTAPAGSTVTCSKGDITKNAEEINGTWTFKNCDVGDWTLHAISENEEQETTSVVSVSETGQLIRYHVTLAYFAATISVTYPVGSICTCTKGTKVYTAPNTSGTVAFTVPETGDWVVSCNNGLTGDEYKEKSQTVSITIDGQIESVELKYEFIIFGDGITPTFNGYNSYSTYTIVDDILNLKIRSDKKYALTTDTTYDLTDYTVLKCTRKGHCGIGITDTRKSSFDDRIAYNADNGDPDNYNTISSDISSFSGEYYIGLYRWTAVSETSYVSKIWLE